MHNIDRILNEDMSHEYGFLHEGETHPEFGNAHGYAHEGEWENEWIEESDYGHELSEEQMEYELAAELLAVSNEAELDQFFGRLIRRAAKGISGFARSNIGRSLIGGLKGIAKVGLPIAGKVVGGMFGGPVGGALGSKLGGLAANMFEVQMEGMSNEDQEFEIARRIVRLSKAATQNTITNARRGLKVSPRTLVSNSIKQAAVLHAPGLLVPVSNIGSGSTPYTGTGAPYSTGGNPLFPMEDAPYEGGAGSSSDDTFLGLSTSGTWMRQGNQLIINL